MTTVHIETTSPLIQARLAYELDELGMTTTSAKIIEERGVVQDVVTLAGGYVLKAFVDKISSEVLDSVAAAIKRAMPRRPPPPARYQVPIYGPDGELLRMVEIERTEV